jgi:hypothetical protein
MRWPVVGLVLVACGVDPEPPPDPIAVIGLEAWGQAALAAPVSECRLDQLDVRHLPAELYPLACPAQSWACLRWGVEAPLGHVPAFPIVEISPAGGPEDRLAVHELMHAIGRCSFRWADTYDYTHHDPVVWGPPPAVEGLAKESL